ncbi:hypothetical protein C6P45_004261 [Maudiozyma exigua]|uniref:Uncharacterized protein n=1 Tax=Maudiozyma exigua TaxID=34358 RepID=A0A9P6WAU2_MAUEX|nr:hypothetical protein C6P45_004261 [Kazachstania exigua]
MDKYSTIINSEKFSTLSLNATTYPKSLVNWENLLNYLIKTASPINKTIDGNTLRLITSIYESLLFNFPYLENYHVDYALLEYKLGNISSFHKIFKRALYLHNNRSLVLWISYLKICNEIVIDTKQLFKKYETAERYIGLHYHSGVFWMMYLDLLKLRCKTNQKYFIVLRKILEIPLHSFSNFYALWLSRIDDIRDLSELTYFIAEDDLLKKLKINKHYSGRKGPYLKEAKKAIKKFTKELYMVIQLHVLERYNLFESKLISQYYTSTDTLYPDVQIQTWSKYIDYTIELEIPDLIEINFQRALITFANYEFFWIKYAKWLINVSDNLISTKHILIQGLKSSTKKTKIIKLLSQVLISLNEIDTLDNILQELDNLYQNDITLCEDDELFWDYIEFGIFIANSSTKSRYGGDMRSLMMPQEFLDMIQKRLRLPDHIEEKNKIIHNILLLQSKENTKIIEDNIFKYVLENTKDDYLSHGQFWQDYCHLIFFDSNMSYIEKRQYIVKQIWPKIPKNDSTLKLTREFSNRYLPEDTQLLDI